jgi:hypothetical protein
MRAPALLTILAAVLLSATISYAQPAPPPDTTPSDLLRIREALEREPIDISSPLPTFRIEIEEFLLRTRRPWEDDSPVGRNVRVPVGGLWHYEFLNMVTPPEARGAAMYTNGEVAQLLASGLIAGLAMKAVGAVVNDVRNAERNAIREQVRRELEIVQQRWEEAQREAQRQGEGQPRR